MPDRCPLCELELRLGDAVCSHSGCAAQFHKSCYLRETSEHAEVGCPVCDRCWVFTTDRIYVEPGERV